MVPPKSADLEQAILSLLEEPHPEIRATTLLALSDYAGARLWSAIETSLKSTDRQERLAAIVAAERTHCFHLEERITLELSSEDARIAGAAARAISVLNDTRTRNMLMQMLGLNERQT